MNSEPYMCPKNNRTSKLRQTVLARNIQSLVHGVEIQTATTVAGSAETRKHGRKKRIGLPADSTGSGKANRAGGLVGGIGVGVGGEDVRDGSEHGAG
eukprot:757589-Hanusia_phi.AAC.3